MALSRIKTWNAAETLTAADLNAEFNNICNHFGSIDNDDVVSTASYVLGELVIGAGITSADGGQLHVYTASAGSVQAHADADEGVFENSGNSGITILSGASNTGNIHFGDTDNDIGKISYNHSTNGFTVTANNATAAAISSAGVLTTGGNIVSDTDSTDDLGTTSVRWANVYTDAIGDSGQALGVKATTFSFDAASTIDTSGNNALTLDAGSAVLTLDGGTIESDATTLSFDAATSIDTSGNNALTLDAGSAVLTLDGGTIESDATTLSFDAATSIDTSGNNNLTLSAGTATLGVTAGDVTIFDDNNNADTSLSMGTSATEALKIEVLNGTSTKTAEEIKISTATASGTGHHGKISFHIDGVEIFDIDDDGIDMASGKTVAVDGTDLTSGSGASLSGTTDNGLVTATGADAMAAETSATYTGEVLTVTSATSNLPKVELKNTNADGTAGILQFTKDSASGADSDTMGTISFFGTDASNNTEQELAKIEGIVAEADHGSETGKLTLSVAENDGTVTAGLALTGSTATDGEIDVTIGAGADSVTEIAGVIKAASLPCFSVMLSGTQSNVTGDATNYIIPFDSTPRFDQGSDFTTSGGGTPVQGTFTAPVNGRYWLKAMVRIASGLTLDHTEFMVSIVTSNTTYYAQLGPMQNVGGQAFELNGSALADMEASDIAQIKVDARNDSKTVDVAAGSYFQGHLVCGF